MADIISVQVLPTQVEIVYRERSNEMLCTYPPQAAPDRVWKEIYKVAGGELVWHSRLHGVHTPQTFLPERIEFPAQP